MSHSKKLATAALAGLFTASMLASAPAFAGEEGKSSCTGKEKAGAEKANCKTATGEKEKHACKGKNSCHGQGGDGKNTCAGKGSCATDGSHSEGK